MQFNPTQSPDPPPLLSLEDVKGENGYGNTEPLSFPDPPRLIRQNGYVPTLPPIEEEKIKWTPQPKRGRKRPYRMVNPNGRDRGEEEEDYKVSYCTFDKRTYRNETKEVENNIQQNEMDETVYELCKRPGALGF